MAFSPRRLALRLPFYLGAPLLFPSAARSLQEPAPEEPTSYEAPVAEASDEGERARATLRVAPGMELSLWAAEPLVANPVALWIDTRGRCFVAETFRQETEGVPDNRGHMYWVPDDLASQTVEDRRRMYLEHHPEYEEEWVVHHDRIRRLADTDGDGVADVSTVYADGFNDLLDGTGAGVLARGDSLYYTCLPHLWRLRDTDDDGVADARESLSSGYGVRVALRGHDLHGLRIGFDGRLYFSIGDRGYNVRTAEGAELVDPGSGAVFRCELDGSGLEVFATGLRNPQELAFNDYGDLFTGDNNCDAGDRARLVYVVEGGDCGWKMNYQYVGDRGPWMPEKLWETPHEGQPAFVNAPIAHVAAGPSGFTSDPGTGLSEEWRGQFFLCDFRGGPTSSGVLALDIDRSGAGYALTGEEQFLWGTLATDVDFGPDGALYVSDWVDGWVGTGKGRVYRVAAEGLENDVLARETQALLAGDFGARSTVELLGLLDHPDRRVRLEAQFALVVREAELRESSSLLTGIESIYSQLVTATREAKTELGRIHAIWAIGQIARQTRGNHPGLIGPASNGSAEERAQAMRAMGEASWHSGGLPMARRVLRAGLTARSARVRYHAAQSLGRIGESDDLGAVRRMLRDNADEDRFLRHAGVMALAGIGDLDGLGRAVEHKNVAVRRAAVLALRKLGSPLLVNFLADEDPAVAAEAALAIYDVPVRGALPALAATLERADVTHSGWVRRAVGACDRLGTPEDAALLARYAANSDGVVAWRRKALEILLRWGDPPLTETVHNLHEPREPRDPDAAAVALRPLLPALLGDADERVQELAIESVSCFRFSDFDPQLEQLVADSAAPGRNRAAALDALWKGASSGLWPALQEALGAEDAVVRSRGAVILAALDRDEALELFELALVEGTTLEQQTALRELGRMDDERSAAALAAAADRLHAGELDDAVLLELLEALRARSGDPGLATRLARYESGLDAEDPLSVWLPALAGGDVERGRLLFFGKAEIECQRCHSLGEHRAGDGITAIGPDLTEILPQRSAMELLESIVVPNRTISEGYENVGVELASGADHLGRLLAENDTELTMIITLEDGTLEPLTVTKSEIVDRWRNVSPMPMNLSEFVTLAEMRDLIAFLRR